MAERKSLDAFVLSPVQKKRRDLRKVAGDDLFELMRGDDGKTPKKGEDYFTEDEKLEFAKIVADLVPKAQNGLDGLDGKDGINGKDGKDADEEAIVARIMPLIRIPEDGKDADVEAVAKKVYDKLKKKIKDLSPEEAVDLINLSDTKIKQSAIEGLDDRFKEVKDVTDRSIKQNIRFAGGNTSITIKANGVKVGQVETINFIGSGTFSPVGDGREVNYTPGGGSANVATDTAAATDAGGNNVNIALTQFAPNTVNAVLGVWRNGALQNKSKWSVVGTVLTLTGAVSTNDFQIQYTY